MGNNLISSDTNKQTQVQNKSYNNNSFNSNAGQQIDRVNDTMERLRKSNSIQPNQLQHQETNGNNIAYRKQASLNVPIQVPPNQNLAMTED